MRPAPLYGLLLFSVLAQANTAPSTEIRVSLFGQPCTLKGPVDERSLRQIHALSPEQIYPEREPRLSGGPTRRSLEKLRAFQNVPAALDHYRERLIKRLEAQLVLLEALEGFRKNHKSAPIMDAAKTYLSPRRIKEFEVALKKADIDQIFDTFSDGIEPDPEEEFHRAIHRMSIQYACSFEGSDNESD